MAALRWCRHHELTEDRIQGIVQAVPAIQDQDVIEAKQVMVQVIAQLLRSLLEGIANLDRKIEEASRARPDFFIFQSLPGAGAALVPRLLAAFRSQRDPYDSADEVLKHSGIAPVTETSGKKKWVHFRSACAKFLRQSFYEWAGHSIAQSLWARAYYQQQRERGLGHYAARAAGDPRSFPIPELGFEGEGIPNIFSTARALLRGGFSSGGGPRATGRDSGGRSLQSPW